MPMVATQGIELLVIDVEQDLDIDINTINLIFFLSASLNLSFVMPFMSSVIGLRGIQQDIYTSTLCNLNLFNKYVCTFYFFVFHLFLSASINDSLSVMNFKQQIRVKHKISLKIPKIIRIRKSKNRQRNGQEKNYKQRSIKHTYKTKDRATRTPQTTG